MKRFNKKFEEELKKHSICWQADSRRYIFWAKREATPYELAKDKDYCKCIFKAIEAFCKETP